MSSSKHISFTEEPQFLIFLPQTLMKRWGLGHTQSHNTYQGEQGFCIFNRDVGEMSDFPT